MRIRNSVVRLKGCGGVCVRAGQRQWTHLLRTFPDRYAAAERGENELRRHLGDVAILRERPGRTTRPLTLAELRHRTAHPRPMPERDDRSGT
jgi:hypothetical protein